MSSACLVAWSVSNAPVSQAMQVGHYIEDKCFSCVVVAPSVSACSNRTANTPSTWNSSAESWADADTILCCCCCCCCCSLPTTTPIPPNCASVLLQEKALKKCEVISDADPPSARVNASFVPYITQVWPREPLLPLQEAVGLTCIH